MPLNPRSLTGVIVFLACSVWCAAAPAQTDSTPVPFSAVMARVDALLENERFPDAPKFASWLARTTDDMRRVTKDAAWALPVDVTKLLAITRVNRQRIRTRGSDFSTAHFGAGSIDIPGVARISHVTRGGISAGACDISHATESVVRIDGNAKIAHVRGCVVIARNASMASAVDSIIIVDGHVTISHSRSSIIIARGAVKLATSNADLIAAGRAICISHINPTAGEAARSKTPDAQSGPDGGAAPAKKDESGEAGDAGVGAKPEATLDAAPPRNLLVSGGVIRASHAYGGVCIAPRGIFIDNATQVTFLDCGTVRGERTDCTTMTHGAIDARMPDLQAAPTVRLEGVARPREDAPVEAARVKVGDTTHELWFRADGNRIQSGPLADWALTFVDHDIAILTREKRDMLALSIGWK